LKKQSLEFILKETLFVHLKNPFHEWPFIIIFIWKLTCAQIKKLHFFNAHQPSQMILLFPLSCAFSYSFDNLFNPLFLESNFIVVGRINQNKKLFLRKIKEQKKEMSNYGSPFRNTDSGIKIRDSENEKRVRLAFENFWKSKEDGNWINFNFTPCIFLKGFKNNK